MKNRKCLSIFSAVMSVVMSLTLVNGTADAQGGDRFISLLGLSGEKLACLEIMDSNFIEEIQKRLGGRCENYISEEIRLDNSGRFPLPSELREQPEGSRPIRRKKIKIFKNCKINLDTFTYSECAFFENCEFNFGNSDRNFMNIVDGFAVFDNCTFNGCESSYINFININGDSMARISKCEMNNVEIFCRSTSTTLLQELNFNFTEEDACVRVTGGSQVFVRRCNFPLQNVASGVELIKVNDSHSLEVDSCKFGTDVMNDNTGSFGISGMCSGRKPLDDRPVQEPCRVKVSHCEFSNISDGIGYSSANVSDCRFLNSGFRITDGEKACFERCVFEKPYGNFGSFFLQRGAEVILDDVTFSGYESDDPGLRAESGSKIVVPNENGLKFQVKDPRDKSKFLLIDSEFECKGTIENLELERINSVEEIRARRDSLDKEHAFAMCGHPCCKNDVEFVTSPGEYSDKIRQCEICKVYSMIYKVYGDNKECPICFENKPLVTFFPCGHRFLCRECLLEMTDSRNFLKCPYCGKMPYCYGFDFLDVLKDEHQPESE